MNTHIQHKSKLKYKHLGIETQHEHIVFMRVDCHVCMAEGLSALTRVQVIHNDKVVIASLNVFTGNHFLEMGQVGLSNSAAKALCVQEGDELDIQHMPMIRSLSFLRSKIYGNTLNEIELNDIIKDVVDEKYSNVHLSAFVTACAGDKMDLEEIIGLTKVMIAVGSKIDWGKNKIIADKHCVGGLPGNRTTPIVVSIVAAAGLVIPKTSSRAITSPAGTADTMESITNVELSLDEIKKVIEKENGCVVWGGTANLSPADDILIRVERALDIDSEGQMIASVLSKKVAAGSTHVVIDIPVGPTAKVRTQKEAHRLEELFYKVSDAVGLKVKVTITNGSQPVGKGIGPALEAIDILSVLRNETDASADLRERALLIAGNLLEITNNCNVGDGYFKAMEILESGIAYDKFMSICKAQGGFKEPEKGMYYTDVIADVSGVVTEIDNRKLARIAKLAGAPQDKGAGIWLNMSLGKEIKEGDVLFTVYAESAGELNYALNLLNTKNGKDLVCITK